MKPGTAWRCIHTSLLLCYTDYPIASVPAQSSSAINHQVEEDETADPQQHRSILPSTQPTKTSNETITYLIQSLTSINSLTTDQRQPHSQRGDNYDVKRERIRLLGADITSNKSLQISSIIRSYTLDILSNISYNRDYNMTQDMISHLYNIYLVSTVHTHILISHITEIII